MSRGIGFSSSSSSTLLRCNSAASFISSNRHFTTQLRKQPFPQCAAGRRRSTLPLPGQQMQCFGDRKKQAAFIAAAAEGGGVPHAPLDLTEDNVRQVLGEARLELGQLFDGSVGITGEAELAELDGPYVKISLKGRFWHKRSTVLARLGNYLQQRIPEILEVDIEDEKQLDDSPASF